MGEKVDWDRLGSLEICGKNMGKSESCDGEWCCLKEFLLIR